LHNSKQMTQNKNLSPNPVVYSKTGLPPQPEELCKPAVAGL
jgi:hypothetical protein